MGAGRDVQVLVNVLSVCVHRAIAEAHLFGRFFVTVALHQVVEHVVFPKGELLPIMRPGGGAFERLDYLACNVAGHRG